MKKVTINFNFSNKVAYTLITLLVLVVAVGIINAYGTYGPETFGHSAGEIEFGIDDSAQINGNVFNSGDMDDLSDATNNAYSFTASATGKVLLIAKGNFGTMCGSGAGARVVKLLADGVEMDSAFSYVYDNHCGSRSFTLMADHDVVKGESYILNMKIYNSAGELSTDVSEYPSYVKYAIIGAVGF